MVGNVWEWTHSMSKVYPYDTSDGRENEKVSGFRVLRGGSFFNFDMDARCARRTDSVFNSFYNDRGFRVVVAPPLPE